MARRGSRPLPEDSCLVPPAAGSRRSQGSLALGSRLVPVVRSPAAPCAGRLGMHQSLRGRSCHRPPPQGLSGRKAPVGRVLHRPLEDRLAGGRLRLQGSRRQALGLEGRHGSPQQLAALGRTAGSHMDLRRKGHGRHQHRSLPDRALAAGTRRGPAAAAAVAGPLAGRGGQGPAGDSRRGPAAGSRLAVDTRRRVGGSRHLLGGSRRGSLAVVAGPGLRGPDNSPQVGRAAVDSCSAAAPGGSRLDQAAGSRPAEGSQVAPAAGRPAGPRRPAGTLPGSLGSPSLAEGSQARQVEDPCRGAGPLAAPCLGSCQVADNGPAARRCWGCWPAHPQAPTGRQGAAGCAGLRPARSGGSP